MILKPIGCRVVVEPIADARQTPGGLVLPDVAVKRPEKGFVIAVGPGEGEKTPPVAQGDVVLFARYSGHEVGDAYRILGFDDLMAKIVSE